MDILYEKISAMIHSKRDDLQKIVNELKQERDDDSRKILEAIEMMIEKDLSDLDALRRTIRPTKTLNVYNSDKGHQPGE